MTLGQDIVYPGEPRSSRQHHQKNDKAHDCKVSLLMRSMNDERFHACERCRQHKAVSLDLGGLG